MSTESVASSLPFEILINIFKDSGEKYQSYGYRGARSIKACSLVCTTWRFAAQTELFSELTIHNHRKPLPEFYTSVANEERYARFAIYIKHLVICADAGNLATHFGEDWVKFLKGLTNLRSVTFRHAETETFLLPRCFDTAHRDAFLHVFSLPRLTTLEIDKCRGFPLALIGHFPNLQTLTLRGWQGVGLEFFPNCDSRQDLEQEDWDAAAIQLKRLTIDGGRRDNPAIANFLSRISRREIISISHLTTLELGFFSAINSDDASVLALCSSIEELVLDFSKAHYFFHRISSDTYQGINPKHVVFKHLRKLEIRYCQVCLFTTYVRTTRHIVEEWVLPLLHKLPRPDVLESVVVLMENSDWRYRTDMADLQSFVDGPGARLQNLLRDGMFSSLVHVLVRYPWTERELEERTLPST